MQVLFPASRRVSQRRLYYIFLAVLTVVTCLTMLAEAPGPLILLSAVIGFAGTVIFPVALYFLNHRLLPASLPGWAKPKRSGGYWLALSFIAYAVLAVLYLYARFAG